MSDPTGTSAESGVVAVRGASPFATGGGVTLEQRAVAVQLARLLTGATARASYEAGGFSALRSNRPRHRVERPGGHCGAG